MTRNGETSKHSNGTLHVGDRVLIVDAPSWCRRYVKGKRGRVARVLPFAEEPLVWVRFRPAITPWCPRMGPLQEFPLAAGQLKLVPR